VRYVVFKELGDPSASLCSASGFRRRAHTPAKRLNLGAEICEVCGFQRTGGPFRLAALSVRVSAAGSHARQTPQLRRGVRKQRAGSRRQPRRHLNLGRAWARYNQHSKSKERDRRGTARKSEWNQRLRGATNKSLDIAESYTNPDLTRVCVIRELRWEKRLTEQAERPTQRTPRWVGHPRSSCCEAARFYTRHERWATRQPVVGGSGEVHRELEIQT
jgi:hypothetical protein